MTISAFDTSIASEQLTLVDFYATWCGACRAIEPTLERVELTLGERVTLLRIDIDTISTRQLIKRYNIVSVPTLILFCRGKIVWRESGIISFERLRLIIRRHEFVGIV